MISKEFTAPKPTSNQRLAGWKAEKQMAFSLDRAFGRESDVHTFHDVRYDLEGDTAQIDHLVLHRFGFCIVESKSMIGTVTVDQHGEFTRNTGQKNAKGIPSPILQAERQAKVLKNLLIENQADLRRKILLRQGTFGEERFRIFAALSDHSVIKRLKTDPPELMKADRVTDAIEALIKSHKNETGLRGFVRHMTAQKPAVESLPPYTDDEMEMISYFLLRMDTKGSGSTPAPKDAEPNPARSSPPKSRPAAHTAPDIVRENRPTFKTAPPSAAADSGKAACCSKCQTTHVEIRYGRNYYFKCLDCDGNTPIKQICPACGEAARLKKSGTTFRWNCAGCGCGDVFFVNGE